MAIYWIIILIGAIIYIIHLTNKINQLNRDPVTNVMSRQNFDKKLIQMKKKALKTGNQLAVLFLDIDHFKKVNDTYGHQIGDSILNGLAGRIEYNIKKGSDIIYRYGGEEFVILLPNITADQAVEIAERIRLSVDQYPFRVRNNPLRVKNSLKIPITISIGISIFPDHTDPVMAADLAMYQAKQSGRNKVCMYSQ